VASVYSATVAVVDDDSRLLEALENLLTSAGYETLLFSSAEQFLAADVLHEVVCVISDIEMPLMSGVELLSAIRRITPEMPVILISAHCSSHEASVYTDLGANLYLPKPFDATDMLRAIRESIPPL